MYYSYVAMAILLIIFMVADRERRVILSAMRHWEEKTCLRFRPKVSTDQYYVVFMSGPVGV